MRQYLEAKERYPDAILFFRCGDFYEMFFEDAVLAARLLELTLTSRDKGKDDAVPMCGVPHHAARGYLAKLTELGQKVAICEQMEDPKLAKGLVKREVVRVITPGVVIDDDVLDPKRARYVAAIALGAKGGDVGSRTSTPRPARRARPSCRLARSSTSSSASRRARSSRRSSTSSLRCVRGTAPHGTSRACRMSRARASSSEIWPQAISVTSRCARRRPSSRTRARPSPRARCHCRRSRPIARAMRWCSTKRRSATSSSSRR